MINLKIKFQFIIAMILFLFSSSVISKAVNDFEKLPIQLNPSLVISQLYVGGGATNALFKNDFVELHNKSGTPVALGGKSIQVSTATGNFLAKLNLPNVSIVGGGFYFIQFGSDGNNGVILPTPDASSAILLPMNAGKVALVNSTNALSCGSANLACSSTQSDLIIDLVAYGSVGGITEGTSLAALNEGNVARRNPLASACTDSNNNNNDFSIVQNASVNDIRNSSSTLNSCLPSCTSMVYPEPNSSAPAATFIHWNKVGNATGYFINIGTTPTGSEVVNNLDVGGITTYTHPTAFSASTTFYVKITPYNSSGVSPNCSTQSFTTAPNYNNFDIWTEKDGEYIVVKTVPKIAISYGILYVQINWPSSYQVDLAQNTFVSAYYLWDNSALSQYNNISFRGFEISLNNSSWTTNVPKEIMRIKTTLNSPSQSLGVFGIGYAHVSIGPGGYDCDVKNVAQNVPIFECGAFNGLTISPVSPNCQNSNSGSINFTSTQPIVSYTWENGQSTGSGGAVGTIPNLAAGSYNLSVTCSSGCVAKKTIAVKNICYPKFYASVYLSNLDTINGMSPFANLLGNFPLIDPYSNPPFNSAFTHVNNPKIDTTTQAIANTYPVIDWLFLELRKDIAGISTPLYTKSVLLTKYGYLRSANWSGLIEFPNAPIGDYYLVLRHRNHLGISTLNPLTFNGVPFTLNFRDNSVPLKGSSNVKKVGSSFYTMIAGDSNFDGSIDSLDSSIWNAQNGSFDDYLLNADYNLDGSVDSTDSAIWEINNGQYEEIN